MSQHTRHLSSSVPNSRNPSFLSQSPAVDPYEHPITASPYSTSRSAHSTPSASFGNGTMHHHAGSIQVESESILPMSANNTISTITGSAPPRKPRPRSGSSAAAFYSPNSQSSTPMSSASSQSPISPSVPFPHPSTSQQMQANKSKNFLSRFNLGGLRSNSSSSATSLASSSTGSISSSSTTTSPTSSQTTVTSASPPSLALPANPREDATLASGTSPHHRVKRKPVPQNLDLTLLNPSSNQPTSVTSPANFTNTGRRASTISLNSLGSISTPNLSSFTSADLAPVHGLDSDTDDDEEAREHKANALRRVTSDKTNQQKRVATSGGGSGSGNGVPAGLPAERSRKSSLPGGAVEGHGEEKKKTGMKGFGKLFKKLGKLGEDDPNHSSPHSPTSPSHRKYQNGIHSEPASQTSSMSSMDPPSPRHTPPSPTTANSGEPDEQEFLKRTLRDYATAYSHILSDADQKRKNSGNTAVHARRQSDVTGSSRSVAAIATEDRGNRRPLQHGNYLPSSPPLSSSSTNNSRTNPSTSSSRMQHPNEIPQSSSKTEDDMRPRKRDTLQNHLDYFGMNLSTMTATYLASGVVDTPEARAGSTRPLSTPPTISSSPVILSKPPSSSSPTGRVPPPRSSSLNRGHSSRTSISEVSSGSRIPSPGLAGVPSPGDTSISSPVDTGILSPENTGPPNLTTTNMANKLVTNPTVVGVSNPTTLGKVEEEQREVVVPSSKPNPKSGVRSLVMAFEGGGTAKAGIHEKKPSISAITRRVELRTPSSSELSISSKDNLSHIVTSPVDLGPSDRSKRSTKIFVKPGALPGIPTDDPTSPPPGSPAFSDDDDQSSRRYRPSYASANTTSSYYSSAYETASMHSMADSFDELDTAPTSPVLDGFELSPPRASLRARSRENSDTPEIYVVGADPMHDDDGGITSESDDDDEDDDVFVDATGDSQDDIERERVVEKLTKRLSGGHFGSAGGLILSTAPGALAGSIKRNSGQLEDLRALAERAMHFVDRGGEGNARGSGASVATVRGVLRESVATVRGHVRGAENGAGMLGVTADEEEDGGLSDATVMADERSKVKAKAEKGDEPDLEDQARDAARKCWMEDPSFVEKEKMAEFLGLKKPLNSQALTFYMEYFDFSDQRLDYAFRKLCQKLYFKAEAQQIDRILEVFANRYFECNPKSLYGSTDVVYAVVYSVLLLNTDLHVAQGSYTKMSRSAFVKNTMGVLRDQSEAFLDSDAFDHEHTNSQTTSSTGTGSKQDRPEQTKEWEMDMEAMLKEIYTSVKTHQILQPLTSSSESRTSSQAQRSASPGPQPASPTTSTSGLNRSRSLLNTGRVIKRGVGAAMRKNTKDSVIIPENEVDAPRTSTSASRPAAARRDSNSSVNSANSMASGVGTVSNTHGGAYRAISPTNNSHIAAVFSSSAPFYKEGLVVRKHLLERADQKAKHRDWKECFLIVDRGELRMYRLEGGPGEQGRRSMMSRHSTSSIVNLSDSNVSGGGVGNSAIMSSGQLIGDVNLRHTLANALPPPGYNRQRPHVFALQQPDGGVYLFQAASQTQVNEWVSTCNYWAARESKEPLAGGVSNMEYGWGGCLEQAGTTWSDPDSIMIFEWKPPLPPMVSSPLDEMAQLAMLRRHTDELNNEMDSHKDYKRKIEAKFPRSANLTKALTNWENKSQYLLHEIIKYQNYCDAIEKGLALREQADQAEEESEGVGMQAVIMTASGESPSHSASSSNRNTIDGLLPKVSFEDASKGGQNRTTWVGPDFQV